MQRLVDALVNSFINARARGAEGFGQGFGEREIGMPADFRQRYPGLALWQPIVGTGDIAMRAYPGLLRGFAGFIGGTHEDMGASETEARQLQRDLNAAVDILGARRLGR